MNIVGSTVTVVGSTDPTKVGVRGEVLIDSAKTILIESEGGRITVEKKGSVLQVQGTRDVVVGLDLMGRQEDRLRSRKN
ncbi:MAG TPA: ribonuclease P protein subunit [Nitrososphaerales archaeon]|nr:ribonuclease P protein subunit [Nitrososphaerales archaeon]